MSYSKPPFWFILISNLPTKKGCLNGCHVTRSSQGLWGFLLEIIVCNKLPCRQTLPSSNPLSKSVKVCFRVAFRSKDCGGSNVGKKNKRIVIRIGVHLLAYIESNLLSHLNSMYHSKEILRFHQKIVDFSEAQKFSYLAQPQKSPSRMGQPLQALLVGLILFLSVKWRARLLHDVSTTNTLKHSSP